MNREELIAQLQNDVKGRIEGYLRLQPVRNVVSLDWMESPSHLSKCPVEALATYLTNNWPHMRSKELKAAGLEFVSARAEAQVRDRTRDRFAVAGAWCEENIEPKATLRAIIAEGRWEAFRQDYLQHCQTQFQRQLTERLEQAVGQGGLSRETVAELTDNQVFALAA